MNKIRIAAIVDNPATLDIGPRRVFDAICSDARFDLSAFIAREAPARGGSRAFRLAMALEGGAFARPRSFDAPAFEARRPSLSVLSIESILTGEASYEVLLDFTETGAPAALSNHAQFGTWRLTSFDWNAGFFETRSPVAEVDLLRIPGGQKVARRVGSATYNVKVSAARTAAFIREKSVQLVFRELKRLAEDGAPADLGAVNRRPLRQPGIAEFAAYGAHLVGGLCKQILDYVAARAGIRPGMFILKYGKGGPFDFDPAGAVDIVPPGNCYWADPFLVEEAGETYVFFEVFNYAERRGHISVGKISDAGFTFIGPALANSNHLSYPFIFRHDGGIYMLPETSESRRLEIWRAVDFPCTWELCATALDGMAMADSSLAYHEGSWWLFTNISNDSYDDHCAELHVFRASDPMLSDLEPHPMNPVVIDARTARGGGRVFAENGSLFRVSQDNAYGTYGYGINIMEIARLDMHGYSETLVRRIAPDFEAGIVGCHHADFASGIFIIDAQRKFGGRGV